MQLISSAGGDFKQGYPPWTEISKIVISNYLISWFLCFSTIAKPTCHLEQNWDHRFLENKNLSSGSVMDGYGIGLIEASLLPTALLSHNIQNFSFTQQAMHMQEGYTEHKAMAGNQGWWKFLLRKGTWNKE